jgi:Mitochondrial carrier protein
MSRHVRDGAIDLTAGALGAVAVVYTGQPLDTVKVQMQTCSLSHSPSSPAYRNMVECTQTVFRLDGVRGLYAGRVPVHPRVQKQYSASSASGSRIFARAIPFGANLGCWLGLD